MKAPKLKTFLLQKKWLIAVYALLAVAASVQSLAGGRKTFEPNGIEYTKYNNYVIFRQSFFHLKQGSDLYAHYPQEQWDLFKYTPTFAAAFGALAMLPDWAGLTLWNLLNALLLLLAVYYLRGFSIYQKGIILLICASELMGSIQNSQSNALVAALLILAFGLLQRTGEERRGEERRGEERIGMYWYWQRFVLRHRRMSSCLA